MAMVNGARIRLVRELKGMTQTDLASHVGVTQSAIAQAESGLSTISEELAAKIAFKTGFPLSFFKQDDISEFPLGSLLFRAHKSLTPAEKAEAHRCGQLIYEMVERMRHDRRVKEIPLRLPRLDSDPIHAARVARSHFGLSPDTPIGNLINTIEKAGVFVFSLPIALANLDAYSLWAGSDARRPVVVIGSGKSGDRQRLSIAHEIGHLVLHQAMTGSLKDTEVAANIFAGELLLPEPAMRHEMIAPITLTGLARLKTRWKVSIQALIVRARELSVITDQQYKYLFAQLSARGWRIHEPIEILPEKPRAVRKMAEILYGLPIDWKGLATDAHLSSQFVREVMEAHAERNGIVTMPSSTARSGRLIRFAKEK
jgi:Zn-dependent peptidase ImmA (M78 family)/transcriptional regulator with XRE-family HTH domain